VRSLLPTLAWLLLFLEACSYSPPPEIPANAPAPDAALSAALDADAPSGDAGLASADVGPPTPPVAGPLPLPLTLAEASLGDGGVPLARDRLTLVDPGSSFRVEVSARLPDARLVLLDAQDAMVPVKGELEIGAVSRFHLSPADALRPGSSYALRLDGIAGREVHDAQGRAYQPLSLQLRTTGERSSPPAAKKRRTKRR
jgi:hypothetical protein